MLLQTSRKSVLTIIRKNKTLDEKHIKKSRICKTSEIDKEAVKLKIDVASKRCALRFIMSQSSKQFVLFGKDLDIFNRMLTIIYVLIIRMSTPNTNAISFSEYYNCLQHSTTNHNFRKGPHKRVYNLDLNCFLKHIIN